MKKRTTYSEAVLDLAIAIHLRHFGTKTVSELASMVSQPEENVRESLIRLIDSKEVQLTFTYNDNMEEDEDE